MTRASKAAAGAALAVLALCAPAPAAESPLVLQADVRVAGFRTHQRLADAIRVFGPPVGRHARAGFRHECDVSWPELGLVMRFWIRGCSPSAPFLRATATGERWQTIRHLRIGDRVEHLRDLYPEARGTGSRAGTERWRLFTRGGSCETGGPTAVTSGGRVVELVVSAPVCTIRFP